MKQLKVFSIVFFVFISAALFAKEVTVMEFNDFHGNITKTIDNGKIVPGIEKFVSAVNRVKKESNNNLIAVSAGDNYQGPFISLLTHGAPVNDMFKLIGVKVSAVGNHEFDWGTQEFFKWERKYGITYLGANIIDKKTGKIVDWAKPYSIQKIDGVKIAFIGLATQDTVNTTSKKNLKGIEFANDVTTAQKWIEFLKSGKAPEGKPDAIIALTHIPSDQNGLTSPIKGKEINDLCKNTKGLDAVISGHSHQVVCGYINNIPVVQGGSLGEDLGLLRLYFDTNNKLEKIVPSIVNIDREINQLKDSKSAIDIINKYKEKLSKYYRVIGKAEGRFNRDSNKVSQLGYFVAKVMAKAAGTEIGLTNTGGLRADLPSGFIKLHEIYDISPFDNYLYSIKIKGKDLIKNIENSIGKNGSIKSQFYGINITVEKEKNGKHKITSIKMSNGKPFDLDKYYTVAINDFMYTGGDQFDFSKSIDLKKTKLTIRDSIINYIKKYKKIKPVHPDNYKVVSDNKIKQAA